MHVAVLSRTGEPASLRIHMANLCRQIGALGAEIAYFPEEGPIPPGSDVVWDPGLCMRRIPPVLTTATVPVVATIHGVKAFSVALEDLAEGLETVDELAALKDGLIADWTWFRSTAAAVVAVSGYASEEARRAFGLPSSLVHVIPNGVDPLLFHPGAGEERSPYFLFVGSSNPLKNFGRVVEAYARLPETTRPRLVAIVPGFTGEPAAPGLTIVREELTHAELANWYRHALALVFPSLRETFGLPIVEAMASGCPVITSDGTACAEVAGDAALRVDPRSVDAIADALGRLASDPALRWALRKAGLARARPFTWRASAERHLRLFQSLVAAAPDRKPSMRKIEVTTTNGCRVACQFCPQTAGYLTTGGPTHLDWETFTTSVDKLSPAIGVSFGGMSEPFQNPRCLDMVLYAKERGHTLEIFTTLVGLDPAGVRRLLSRVTFGGAPADDRLFVHVPSDGDIEHIPLTAEYLEMLELLLATGQPIEFHYHVKALHEGLRHLPFGSRLKYWAIHNRAENETVFYRKGIRKTGRIACVMNFEVNMLMPNGDVLICCQDFGARHVIGNLARDDRAALYQSDEFRRIQAAHADDTQDIMCRYCHFSIQEGAAGGPAA